MSWNKERSKFVEWREKMRLRVGVLNSKFYVEMIVWTMSLRVNSKVEWNSYIQLVRVSPMISLNKPMS